MSKRGTLAAAFAFIAATAAQGQMASWLPDITQQQIYTLHRSSSRESTGANADYRTVTPGQTLTILDVDGPGMISHIWFTLNDREPYHLERIVLRIYWDGEESPSVETPIGDFFGLGNGVYYPWQSAVMSVGADRSMNCWFPMPYAKHARATITNEGKESLNNLYWNIDYRVDARPLTPGTLYFHADYRQAQANHGWAKNWYENGDPQVNFRRDLDGKDNFEWFEAKGHGQFVGVTMSVLQNQDGWWGEGNDMFFIDGATTPTMVGTGSEDYFLGAWDFGVPASFPLHGSPVVGAEIAGSRSSVYRFHLDSPIPFTKSMRAGIEHGHGNARSDSFSSVAYWYQAEPHLAFPPLPEMSDRIPTLQFVGGPGNSKEPYVPGSPQPR
jgi:D-arabinan exo alpha-(1,3)/(1,5)-arabinofuranosidase (non-reducing end)